MTNEWQFPYLSHNIWLNILFWKLKNKMQKRTYIHKDLYKTQFVTAWYWIEDSSKMDPRYVSKQQCIDYIEEWPFMVIFLYSLYIFVWIQHCYLFNTVVALVPSNLVMVYMLFISRNICLYIAFSFSSQTQGPLYNLAQYSIILDVSWCRDEHTLIPLPPHKTVMYQL